MIPEWVENHKKPGTTVKKIGKNYYLYFATSSRKPGKKYPVSEQTYIGKITPDGVIRDRVSINVLKTPAAPLRELLPSLPGELGDVIAIKVRNEWLCTKTERDTLEKLEKEGVVKDGKVIFSGIQ